MGWLKALAEVGRRMLGVPSLEQFAAIGTAMPIAELLAELNTVTDARVSADQALSVAAVQRGRNEMASLATLPLRLYRGLNVVDHPLFRQIDPDRPNVNVLADTVQDLIFEKNAWWRVIAQDFDGYPMACRYVPVGAVSLEPPKRETPPPGRWVWVSQNGVTERVPMSLMIRFESPNPGLLTANARAIRRALLLDRLASTYADNPRPLDYFTDNTDDPNVVPFSDSQWTAFLSRWRSERKRSSTARVPGQVKRVDVNAPSPAELQLVELQRQVTIEIANGIGVDAEDLGVSTTSRTYQNEDARRRDKINRVYAPIMSAITGRLSMGDVTRRGYTVQFDLTDYLKADPQTQIAYWEGLQRMGVTDADEIRGWAGLPGRAPAAAATPALPAGAQARALPPGSYSWGAPAGERFAGPGAAFTFDRADFAGDAPAAPSVDAEKRTITGLALPYGAITSRYGIRLRFRAGSLEYDGNVKHYKDHVTPVGAMTSLVDSAQGPTVTLSVLGGPEGSAAKAERDQLLYDAQEGLYNGLSVGVDFELFNREGGPGADVEYVEADDVYDVVRATLREVSTTPMPAFNDARVTKVAASMTGGNGMDECQHCHLRHAAGMACATAQALFAANQPQPAPGTPPAPQPGQPAPQPAPGTPTQVVTPDAATFAAWQAFQQAQQAVGALPQAGAAVGAVRQFVDAGASAVARVSEPSPYRFDRRGNLRPGTHDFLSDLIQGFEHHDAAARDRAQGFMSQAFADGTALANETLQQQFAVTSGNVSALNPNRNRPDLYVDQMEYQYPLWEAINKGPLEDITPFVVPKFNSSSGLVNNHTEGTEPTPGTFTATAQTITPSAVSGKVEYTREAWDQGGNPQASNLIWRQMVRGYYEALEAYAVSSIAALAASITDIDLNALGAGASVNTVDSSLDQALKAGIVPLHFVRGGQRFRKVFTQVDLYKALASARDSAGRPLYPSYNPMNASGAADDDLGVIRAAGLQFLPAWALAATSANQSSSWMFDPEKMCGWATAPQRIDITWRVAWVDIGVWGYKAFACLDTNGARELLYDPVRP